MITYREVGGAALEALEARNAAPVRAVPVPFGEWAQQCMGPGGLVGLAHGWHVLAAGRSGEGKTYLALNVAATAIEWAEAVTFHSLEMGWDELAVRILAIVSGEPLYRLSPGPYYDRARFRAASAALELARGQLVVNNIPMYKLTDLVAGIKRNFEEYGSRLHVIDYLQLAWTGDAESQVARITEVSHAVRQLAAQLEIVTLCLSQFNRATSAVRNEKPQKEGMIGGSALENDADQVILMDHSRRKLFRDPQGRAQGWDGWLILDKNRHGPTGAEIPIRFSGETGRMRERLPDELPSQEKA